MHRTFYPLLILIATITFQFETSFNVYNSQILTPGVQIKNTPKWIKICIKKILLQSQLLYVFNSYPYQHDGLQFLTDNSIKHLHLSFLLHCKMEVVLILYILYWYLNHGCILRLYLSTYSLKDSMLFWENLFTITISCYLFKQRD